MRAATTRPTTRMATTRRSHSHIRTSLTNDSQQQNSRDGQ